MTAVLEAIPLIVLGVEMLIKLVDRVIQKAEEHKQMKELAAQFYDYALSSDEQVLRQIKRRAELVFRNPAVSYDDKHKLHELMTATKRTIDTINADLDEYLLEAEKLYSRGKKKLLKKIDNNSRRLKTDFSRFQTILDSQQELAQSPESLLATHDLDIYPEETKIWVTESTRIAKGRFSRKTNGVEAGEHTFVLGVRPYGRTARDRMDAQTATMVLNQHLASEDIMTGIPRVMGFRNEESPHADGSGEFQLVMQIPGITPTSGWFTLRKCMGYDSPRPSLNERLRLCANLADAVFQVHRLKLVHKNIGPESILIVSDATGTVQRQQQQQQQQYANLNLAKLYLIDWEHARQTKDYQTRKVGDGAWTKNIYQHPQRQGKQAESEYCMGHDIYSLGVCMLEILGWEPLVVWQDNDTAEEDALISAQFKHAFLALSLDQQQEALSTFYSEADWLTNKPSSVKLTLLSLTETRIPILAGRRMAGIVNKCLNCLDEGSDGAQHDTGVKQFQERDQKEIGVEFAEEILAEIRAVECAI